MSSVKKKINAQFKAAKKKLAAAERNATKYISSHPKKAVAIAAAVGAAVGAAIAAGVAAAIRKYKKNK